MKDTLDACGMYGIDYVGGGKDVKEASQTFYKNIAGHILAIINCCEHEFSIATESTGGSNPLNLIQQYYAIQEAKIKADYVLVIVHGGHEHWQLPSPRMKEAYRFFIDSGADAVVNHHQHCYSGYEIYQGKPIFYGLGNFCFDSPSYHEGFWTEGYVVSIDFTNKETDFNIIPYRQCASEPKIELLEKDAFDVKLKEINSIIADYSVLQQKNDDYYSTCANQYSNIFEPVQNYYYLAAKDRGWLPSFIRKKQKLIAANYVCCEAHRDKLVWWLCHKF